MSDPDDDMDAALFAAGGLTAQETTALKQRINVKTDLARAALREAAVTTAARNPEVLLYRGRVEREVGDIDSALAAFRGYQIGRAHV